jgi:lysophospholipase L1-like esterase
MFLTLSSAKATLVASLLAFGAAASPTNNPNMLSKRGQLEDLIGGQISIRVMPLGASITYGLMSSDDNGYRARLRDLIVSTGGVDTARVDMVGTLKSGTMQDNDVEGYSGLRIDEIKLKADVAVPKYTPNLITLNVGTNDAAQDYQVSTAKDRMRDMVNFLLNNMSPGPVVLSTLLVNGNSNSEANVVTINAGYRELVQEFQSAGKRVVLAEMHDVSGLGVDNLVDGTHPNDAGYQRMGEIWWDAILDAAERGYFVADSANSDDAPTVETTSSGPATTTPTPTVSESTPTITDAAESTTAAAEPTPETTTKPNRHDKGNHGSRLHNPVSGFVCSIRGPRQS